MKTSGVILAGGRSSRMRYNKAFAEIGGKRVIDIIVHKFSGIFDETLIISNDPEQYIALGLPVHTDVYPRLGPVSGIHAALYHAAFDSVFVLGCDMPFMNMDLVKYMLDRLGQHDSVIPEINGFLQPISAAYRKTCLPVMTECLEKQLLKLVLIFKELDTIRVYEPELSHFGKVQDIFMNVNDEKALNLARSIAGRYEYSQAAQN
ncbi:MAG TPA: molybdenum cofactor guanylyltransferase [Syntrophomonadaceae bacterium]|nr:molybdenum cofactor guanylyltransferase [Syntrophomonadaceae bacterium]